MWLSTRAPLSDSNLTDTIYALVFFSEPIVVNGSEPTLTFATGSHFESNAAVATGLFVGGGMSTSKGFWRNDAPNPLRSGAALGKAFDVGSSDGDGGPGEKPEAWDALFAAARAAA